VLKTNELTNGTLLEISEGAGCHGGSRLRIEADVVGSPGFDLLHGALRRVPDLKPDLRQGMRPRPLVIGIATEHEAAFRVMRRDVIRARGGELHDALRIDRGIRRDRAKGQGAQPRREVRYRLGESDDELVTARAHPGYVVSAASGIRLGPDDVAQEICAV
jgi:hypothetical protein